MPEGSSLQQASGVKVTDHSRRPSLPYVGLDLVRVVAAVIVMLFHFSWWEWAAYHGKIPASVPTYPRLGLIFAGGWVGVEIFFVLSGFVIAFSAAGSGALDFVRKRFIRLYPAAWICASITALIRIIVNKEPVASIEPLWRHSMLLVPNSTWIDGVYWTLGLEMIFYLILFVLLAFHAMKWLEAVMSVLTLAGACFWLEALLTQLGVLKSFKAADISHHFLHGRFSQILLLQHGCFFAAGVFLWLILLHRPTVTRWCFLTLAVLTGAIEIFFHALDLEKLSGMANLPFAWQLPLALWLGSLVIIMLSVRRNELWSRFFRRRGVHLVRIAALTTYPLYLVHQIVGYEMMSFAFRRYSAFLCLVIACVACSLLAFAIHRFGELPLQRLLRKLTGLRRRDPLPAVSVP
ncbi:acyltransferase family protein [Terriglobus roseus]|uniref:Peptidoglycan/LPS O-acetylase OafA/YrhL, contains acyltransferase and SGNH-hydrolase domains n=1 Tax=Terriglobus roseus TaxID=392734 RepID=A0A1G7R678_9BACT|nr:acyltransferase [Terriglobus roseus]SDG06214.1 Peptidoglycan/LPS O-acetylase OafA/YrhL, contains acyltransferase and SGNH-hydrolase domains [Terriglobus roseus]